MYSPPAAAITTPGVLPFESRGNWNRLQSPGSPQVSWNIIHKEFCEQSGLREVTGNWSRLHCSRQEEDQFSSVAQSCLTPWTAACQASLSITNSWSLIKLMSIESVMPSNHLIPCHPLLLSPSIFPSVRVFSNESVLCIRWPKYWSFSFRISPSNEYSGLISFRMDWLDPLAVQGILKSLLQHHSSKASILQLSAFFIVQLSHPYTSIHDYWLDGPLLAK